MLNLLREGQVYELLLVSKSNLTPVGVVRRGRRLHFRLFPGKSFRDLLESSYAAIQITNDPELLVRSALNLELNLKFESEGEYRWVSNMPGWLGEVQCSRKIWEDEIGTTEVLECEFVPKRELPGEIPLRPFSRADCIIIEMAVLFTRYLVKPGDKTRAKILELYKLYRHLGGTSETAEYILAHLTKGSQK
ncbi:MAG: hypothetical protein PWQ79_313 [Thermococcaceae archaeon]|nr:hypothetical protein [Thermococcaceae archaeon]MDK2913398.1 hypothetical protein [Thermococcaceae archaeon]